MKTSQRISIEYWAMQLAVITSLRSTCARRQCGCILLDERNHVIATGYNGVASGLQHCKDSASYYYRGDVNLGHVDSPRLAEYACPGASLDSGEGLELCMAIHAEQNAILQCSDVYKIKSVYSTTSPCITCTKLLLNTSCTEIVFKEKYPHEEAAELWKSTGRSWIHLITT